jgi:hypothetical protein
MSKFHKAKAFRNTTRFVVINLRGAPGFDITEATGSSASISQDHYCCGATTPTFAHVGATCFLTDRVQFVLINNFFQADVSLTTWHFRSQPIRLSANL